MGRKNRMKSTFVNEVRPGTLWTCHHRDLTLSLNKTLDNRLSFCEIQPGDMIIVLKVRTDDGYNKALGALDIPTIRLVDCVSQRKGIMFTTSLENFYLSYHKVA